MMVEELIKDYNNAYDLNYIILRYFNVAGADPDLRVGQRGDNATHLIKVGLELATEKRDEMTVFGEDYPTRDGTCIRDYIHVSDLALAHYKAVNFLLANDEVSEIFNCGYGTGYTVKEVMGKIHVLLWRILQK